MQALAGDLERILQQIDGMDAEVLIASSSQGQATAASFSTDDSQINRLLLQVLPGPFAPLGAMSKDKHTNGFMPSDIQT